MKDKLIRKIFPRRHSIRSRLVWLFLILIIIFFTAAGYFLKWQIRAALDEALGKNLEVVASTIAQHIDPYFLQQIQPGDEGTRTYRNVRQQLLGLQQSTGIVHMAIFNKEQQIIVDSDSLIRIGQFFFPITINRAEFDKVFRGFSASSILFKGIDGKLFKSGYAPIRSGNEIIAGIAVDGSAEMLEAVTTIQNNMLWIGIIVLFCAIILSNLFANRITTPLIKLEHAASEISSGNLQQKIESTEKNEIGFLATTMEQMRKSILERDKRQQAMLAGVAHEIRNPLGGIELFSGLLANEIKEAELKNYASKISKEVGNLKKIIQGFLDYARPSLAEPTSCDIRSIFFEAASLLENELTGVKISFLPEKERLQIYVDPQHLKQIFLNLLRNSVQAMSNSGTVFVNVKLLKDRAQILFADTGPGIKPEFADKIFDPFFTTREKGTGLGLAIVKNLVEENGGKIKVIDDKKAGAAFLIEFFKEQEISEEIFCPPF